VAFFALENEVAFGHSVVQFHRFALVDATERDHAHVVALLDAGEISHAVVPLRADVVLAALQHARLVDHGQETVVIQQALHTIFVRIEGGVHFDSVSVLGQASFRYHLTVATFVPIPTDVHLCAVAVTAGAFTISAALVGEGGGESRHQNERH